MADKCRDKEWHEAEYIERETVLDLAKKGRLVSNGNYKSVCNSINSIPAADVRPVKRGTWVKNGWSIRCSMCGYDMPFATRNFCPNCGADMRPTLMSGTNEEGSR